MRTFSACESGDETVVRNFLNVGNHMSRVQNSRQLILVFDVFQNLNGVTRAQAFHKLRASSCTRKLRASPKSRKHFKHKFKSKLIYNEKGYTTWWLLWRKPTFEQSVGFGLGLQELPREFRARFAQASRKLRASKGVPGHYAPQQPVAR